MKTIKLETDIHSQVNVEPNTHIYESISKNIPNQYNFTFHNTMYHFLYLKQQIKQDIYHSGFKFN